MEYDNMGMPELKSLARDRGLRNYSRMSKAELVALLQNNETPEGPSSPHQTSYPTSVHVFLRGTLEGRYLGTYR